jgi:hypothetical protein
VRCAATGLLFGSCTACCVVETRPWLSVHHKQLQKAVFYFLLNILLFSDLRNERRRVPRVRGGVLCYGVVGWMILTVKQKFGCAVRAADQGLMDDGLAMVAEGEKPSKPAAQQARGRGYYYKARGFDEPEIQGASPGRGCLGSNKDEGQPVRRWRHLESFFWGSRPAHRLDKTPATWESSGVPEARSCFCLRNGTQRRVPQAARGRSLANPHMHAFAPPLQVSGGSESELEDCGPVVLVFEVRRRGALSGGSRSWLELSPVTNPWERSISSTSPDSGFCCC